MSSGLPFLNKLRKPELTELAEQTDLQEYVDRPYLVARAQSAYLGTRANTIRSL